MTQIIVRISKMRPLLLEGKLTAFKMDVMATESADLLSARSALRRGATPQAATVFRSRALEGCPRRLFLPKSFRSPSADSGFTVTGRELSEFT